MAINKMDKLKTYIENKMKKSKKKKNDNGYEHIETIDGINVCISNILEDGQKLVVYGWRNDHSKFRKGDRVLLIEKDGNASRYVIKKYRPCSAPRDMYFMDMEFNPRICNEKV
jgi:hypothetical protein